MTSPSEIFDRLQNLRQKIIKCAVDAKRNRASVTLVAVSKTKPVELIRQAYQAGQIDFGENYVDELLKKKSQLAQLGLADLPIRWHFVGHLQRRKAKEIVGEVELIHSLDSLELANEINKRAMAQGIVQRCLLQVNLSGEATKSGIQANEIQSFLTKTAPLKNLQIAGLMTLPPFFEDPEKSRPYFQKLRELLPPPLTELSMGMSHDFKMAIEEGATLIRIGSAIFGKRNT